MAKDYSELFKKEYFIDALEVNNKNELFEKISEIAAENKIISENDKSKLIKGFNDRESESSTGFEDGFAIPHARIDEIKAPSIFFVKLKNGID